MNNFMEQARKETNTAYTLNDAVSKESTLNPVLDFFSKSGALRGQHESFLNYFMKAFSEDTSLAKKALFYCRDVRGGQGERENFRLTLRWLACSFPYETHYLLDQVPVFGRWDDLWVLLDSPLKDYVVDIVIRQFKSDLPSNNPSLLGKWMPSENTSSKLTKHYAAILRKSLGISSKDYRKMLSRLRKKIDIVERKTTASEWTEIDYAKVPSNAMLKYRKAFSRHDSEGFTKYLEDVKSGEKTIKSGTLYPYDIVKEVLKGEFSESLQQQWNALPDYLNGENAIAVVDTSASMGGLPGNGKGIEPIYVALSLGLYFAERSKGKFKDYFITFSNNPKIQKIVGNNLVEKILNINNARWDMNTNLQSVFEMLLNTAKKMDATDSDMPSKIYLISDMQFDIACVGNSLTNFERVKQLYTSAGYKVPEVVFWNVAAYSDTPVERDETGTYLVSGASPSILKYAMDIANSTPEKFMLDVLLSDRYKSIT